MKILIVDDNKEIVTFLKMAFEAECFAVDTAEDGQEGSFLARTNEYDAIILDINLPKKDGLAVCKEIRSDGIKTPVLILSVRSEIPTKLQLFSAEADDYLTKPFSFEELLARVKALSRRPKEIESKTLKVGGLTIDTDKNEVVFNEKPVSLTRKEYMLLEQLVKNKDKIVSRGTIMEHVWDINADPFSNTIEVHVRNLRKKLAGGNFIKTVNGRGYLFDSKQLM